MERPKVRKRCAVCGRPLPLKGDSALTSAGVRIEERGQQTLYYCPLHREIPPRDTTARYKRYKTRAFRFS